MSSTLLLSAPLTVQQCEGKVAEVDLLRSQSFTTARRAEYLTWRAMVADYIGYLPEIVYNHVGAPQIVGSTLNIGVSHTADCVAVVLSDRACAVDVERKDRDVERISERFITPDERKLCNRPEELVALWSARECYYKLRQDRSLSMLTDIRVVELDLTAGRVTVEDNRMQSATLRIEEREEHFVVYII